MKFGNTRITTAFVLVALVLAGLFAYRTWLHLTAKGELMQAYARVQLGHPLAADDGSMTLLRQRQWELRSADGDELQIASIETPLALGARNWALSILLDRNIVVAYGIRTLDSPYEHPEDAPGDRVRDEYQSVWRREFSLSPER